MLGEVGWAKWVGGKWVKVGLVGLGGLRLVWLGWDKWGG